MLNHPSKRRSRGRGIGAGLGVVGGPSRGLARDSVCSSNLLAIVCFLYRSRAPLVVPPPPPLPPPARPSTACRRTALQLIGRPLLGSLLALQPPDRFVLWSSPRPASTLIHWPTHSFRRLRRLRAAWAALGSGWADAQGVTTHPPPPPHRGGGRPAISGVRSPVLLGVGADPPPLGVTTHFGCDH